MPVPTFSPDCSGKLRKFIIVLRRYVAAAGKSFCDNVRARVNLVDNLARLSVRAAVGMGIPMGMGMVWVWGL